MDNIRILQLGNRDWSQEYTIPEGVDFFYNVIEDDDKKLYDLLFLDRNIEKEELDLLRKLTKAYTVFVMASLEQNVWTKELCKSKKAEKLSETEIPEFLKKEVRNYFPGPYGEKYKLCDLTVAQNFQGKVMWEGNYSVVLDGMYGREFQQVVFWRNNIPVFQGQAIDFWLEYQCDPDVEITLEIVQFYSGSVDEVMNRWEFTEEQLSDIVTIDNPIADGTIFVSIRAKGYGYLRIIALHDRYSRRGRGYFLPGGKRSIVTNREEIFYYFDPGNLKPPLNVYFSGYKTMEGFEGYYMMKKREHPYLLIAEPRLEGGCFYMGNEEYEGRIVEIIREHMKELGFSSQEVILSGLSMGTFGALYYGCEIHPHAIIVGKPLTSIGNVAANEKRHRPGGFPTSLDVLMYQANGTEEENVNWLNHKFWDKFDETDWRESKFIVAYMIEDDYDTTAYQTLLSHIHSDGIEIYGKGIHGRHNDNTEAIVSWFTSQLDKVLREDFKEGQNAE